MGPALDGDGPAPISSQPSSGLHGKSHMLQSKRTTNMPHKPKDRVNSQANIAEAVANAKSSHDSVIELNFLGKVWIDIRKTPIPLQLLLRRQDPTSI